MWPSAAREEEEEEEEVGGEREVKRPVSFARALARLLARSAFNLHKIFRFSFIQILLGAVRRLFNVLFLDHSRCILFIKNTYYLFKNK